jgi:hypothetical protein
MLTVTVALLLALSAATRAVPGEGDPVQNKPVREIQGSMRPFGVDTDLAGLFRAADVVVHARATATRAADRNVGTIEDPAIIVETAFDLEAPQFFRSVPTSNPSPPLTLIVPHVGDRDRGDRIDRYLNPAVNPLVPGREYLLFLRRRSGGDGWTLVSESGHGVYEIRGDQVAPQASNPNAVKIGAITWTALKQELLQLAQSVRSSLPSAQPTGPHPDTAVLERQRCIKGE